MENSIVLILFISLLAIAASCITLFYYSNKAFLVPVIASGVILIIASYLLFSVDYNFYSRSWKWFSMNGFSIQIGFGLEKFSSLILFLLSLVSFLIYLFSIQYFKNDVKQYRFWFFLTLFCFCMYGLILSDNLFLMYFFWEGVGLCSAMLIGYYFNIKLALLSSRKAFLMNRFGDVFLLLGILILFSEFNTLNYSDLKLQIVNPIHIPFFDSNNYQYLGYCLIIAACIKSAQFPFHGWIPSAMEGPTPVSALIHAATMVAAGVFVLFKFSFLLNANHQIILVCIGAFSALYGAFSAIFQKDLKRILAYSTISQLGFMIACLGFADTSPSINHLFIHGFFKALLFLLAALFIEHLKHSKILFYKIYHLSIFGINKTIKFSTTKFFLQIALLSMVGFPFFSGGLSKDKILEEALHYFESGNYYSLGPIIVLVLASILTIFYSLKTYYMLNEIKMEEKSKTDKLPILFFLPVFILSIFSLYFLFSTNPFLLKEYNYFGLLPSNAIESSVMWIFPIGITVTCFLIFSLWRTIPKTNSFYLNLFEKKIIFWENIFEKISIAVLLPISEFASWIDRSIIDKAVIRTSQGTIFFSSLIFWFDKNIIDASVHGIGNIFNILGDNFRRLQNGKVQNYFTFSFIGLMVIILIIIFYK